MRWTQRGAQMFALRPLRPTQRGTRQIYWVVVLGNIHRGGSMNPQGSFRSRFYYSMVEAVRDLVPQTGLQTETPGFKCSATIGFAAVARRIHPDRPKTFCDHRLRIAHVCGLISGGFRIRGATSDITPAPTRNMLSNTIDPFIARGFFRTNRDFRCWGRLAVRLLALLLASTTAHLIQISRNATGEFGYDWMPISPAGAPLILATPRCVSLLSKIVVNCEAPVSVSVRVTS